MADIRSLTGEAKIKLTRLINEGMQTMHEMDTLREGLNETVKAIMSCWLTFWKQLARHYEQ